MNLIKAVVCVWRNEDFANWCNGFFSDIKAEGLWDQMQSDAAAELDAKALEDFIAQ